MKSNLIQPITQKAVEHLFSMHPLLQEILSAIHGRGGVAYLVGGAVRDLFLDRAIKDIDIEVHDLQPQELVSVLKRFGIVDFVGQSFGVYKLHGLPIDWSLPRADSAGRKPQVIIDPHMSLQNALARRDLTMNAMAINLHTLALADPFNGMQDLKAGILRSPDITFFQEDPLRFFRVMQFIARFNMQPDKELETLCKQMDVSGVSRERIEEEFYKMLMRSKQPSLGLRWLQSIGKLNDVLPELAATVGIKQSPKWHPEGDVFEHTMQAIDAAAALDYPNDERKLSVLYAALCHDLGKVSTTTEDSDGIHSYGHEKESAVLARSLLRHITRNKTLIQRVIKLVRWHMVPLQFVKQRAKLGAYKRLALKLAPDADIALLAKLVLADKSGRNPHGPMPLDNAISELQTFLKRAEQAKVLHHTEPALLTGKDFLDVAAPGPLLGKLVKKAYELQLNGITDKAELKRLVLELGSPKDM